MRRIGCWLLLLALCGPGLAAETPNVLLIVSEDNGVQFGCYGDRTAPTPHVDRLAAHGVRFENAFVTQAVCSPSRSTILTGLYPHQNGQLGLATHRFTMWKKWPTLPNLLKEAGYRTGRIGKLHVLPEDAFDFDWEWSDAQALSFAHRDVARTAEAAGEFIRREARPFFLMVNYADAHLPFLRQEFGVPENPLTAKDVKTLPAVGVDTPRLREHTANYYNCISRLDTGIGLLLEELRASGKAEKTLVIYVGDHGPQFARGKVTSYELGLRVPLIVHWPGRSEAGGVRKELVSTIDLVPTILAAAGAEIPENLPGRSLLPLVEGKSPAWREYVFCEWNVSHSNPTPSIMSPQRSVRDARYKLILNLLPDQRNEAEYYYTNQILVQTGPTQAEIDAADETVRAGYRTWRESLPAELYDLENDPYEFTNLIERREYVEIRMRLLKALQDWRKATDDPLLDEKKLKQLWREVVEKQEQVKAGTDRRDLVWRYPQYLYETD